MIFFYTFLQFLSINKQLTNIILQIQPWSVHVVPSMGCYIRYNKKLLKTTLQYLKLCSSRRILCKGFQLEKFLTSPLDQSFSSIISKALKYFKGFTIVAWHVSLQKGSQFFIESAGLVRKIWDVPMPEPGPGPHDK